MKNTNLIYLSLLLLIFSCTQNIDYRENEEYFSETKGILYYKGSPFTGFTQFYYKNGEFSKRISYKEGKQDGPEEEYYLNGQLFEKWIYEDGDIKPLSTFERYHKNGQLWVKSSLDFSGNLITKKFDSIGKLIQEAAIKDGVCISGDCDNIYNY